MPRRSRSPGGARRSSRPPTSIVPSPGRRRRRRGRSRCGRCPRARPARRSRRPARRTRFVERRRTRRARARKHDRRVARRAASASERRGPSSGRASRSTSCRRVSSRAGAVFDVPAVLEHCDVSQSASTSSRHVRDVDDSHAVVAQLARDLSSRSASTRVSAAVGSSITISRASRTSARRISTFCWSATRSVSTRAAGSMLEADPLGELAEALALLAHGRRRRRAPARRPGTRCRAPTAPARARAPGGSARSRRIASRGERNVTGSPSTTISPSSGCDGAGDDLAERRLARAVLADERVDLPGRDRDADIVERASAAVVLADPPDVDLQAAAGGGP